MRFLLESLLMCALIGGALYLALGSMHSMERIFITVSDFITLTSLSVLNSFRSMVVLIALAFAVLFLIPRGSISRILR